MGEEIITLGNIEVEKHKFHQQKSTASIHDVNNDRILMFLLVKKRFKFFIEYEDDS